MMTNMMGAMGRGGDNMMAHVRSGDVIIPRDVVLENPEFLTKLKKTMQDMGGDYRTHVAGSGYESFNPGTGAPEFFFSGLRRFFRNPGRVIKSFVRDPIGTVLSDVLPPAPAPPPAPTMPAPDLGPVEEEFTPERPEEVPLPQSLAERQVGGQVFGALTPTQQRTNLATQGVYGAGVGPEAEDYYMNLLQRNLLTEGGQMQNINQALAPVERQYLSRRGLPTDDTLQFFQALQG